MSSQRARVFLLASLAPFAAAWASPSNPLSLTGQADSTAVASLDGVVTDSLRRPVAGVEIFSADGRFKTTTNSVGAFHVGGLAPGSVTFGVRKIGYGAGEFTLEMEAGVIRYQTIVLTRLNNVLTPVVVAETQSHRGLRDVGFYERAGNSRGTFLTPEILATRSSTRSSDFIRGVNGVRVNQPRGARGSLPYGTGGYMRIGTQGLCVMNLYIDGSRVEIGSIEDRGLGMAVQGQDPVTLEDVVSPQDIGAIEVYPSGVTSPEKYSGVSRGCGTILIWTKTKLNLPRNGSSN
jgi:hypothetical protein